MMKFRIPQPPLTGAGVGVPTLRPLAALGWIAVMGGGLAAAADGVELTGITLLTGAVFQLMAASIFASLAALWRGGWTTWWGMAGAAAVLPTIALAALVALGHRSDSLQLAAQVAAAALVLMFTYRSHGWRGVLVATAALLIMRGMMMAIFYISALALVILQMS